MADSGSPSDIVWLSWTSANNTSASDNDVVWHNWTDSTSASSYSGNEAVWQAWTSADVRGPVIHPVIHHRSYDDYRKTEEQREARLEQERERKRQYREEQEKALLERVAAQERAEELLRESLEKEQQEQFEKTKWFFVISESGKRYRIRHGWAGNVDELNELDQIVARYCIHPQSRVPIADSMLIQKLMLEADEERFIQIANRTALREPQPVAA